MDGFFAVVLGLLLILGFGGLMYTISDPHRIDKEEAKRVGNL